MAKTMAVIIAIIIVAAGFFLAFKLNLIPSEQYGPYDDFIICLKSSGAKFYGDYANRDSLMQMSFFGDSLRMLEKSGIYIECNPYGPNPKTKKCQDTGIKLYPTWVINGEQHAGIQGLNKLSSVTGCER